MFRLLTVTLNPALDQVYETPNFMPGALNRPTSKTISAGGKGINVARAYRALGGEVFATGLAGGRVGRDIVEVATADGIPSAFVPIEAASRVNTKIVDPATGSQTELNEPGPFVATHEYEALIARVRELLSGFDVLVLSGSVPPGVPVDVYRTLTLTAQEEFGVTVLLDASGPALVAGIEARPVIVKPNRDEAREVGINPANWIDVASELRTRYAIPVALVTAGSEGAVVESTAGRWLAKPPAVTVKSAVGSGDSLTAGFLSVWSEGKSADAIRTGVAAGAVNAENYGSGDITADRVREMAERVIVSAV